MPQDHFDRLTAIDASFLHQEGQNSHMHVGAVSISEGPPPEFEEFLDSLRERLRLVPRYRQKLADAPLQTGRPMWVDDPNFNLEYHVRQTALPEPGSEEQLMRLTSRVFSQQLDRSKPLWENWMVEGLEGNRFALISKTHHALVDGIAGVDLAQVLFDLTPVPQEIPHPDEAWQPAREPNPIELLADGVAGLAKASLGVAARAASAATRPADSLNQLREAPEGLGGLVRAGMTPRPDEPPTPLVRLHR